MGAANMRRQARIFAGAERELLRETKERLRRLCVRGTDGTNPAYGISRNSYFYGK
jgi:hypothetical protein